MSSEDGEVYIMHDGDDEGEWVSPVPARQAILDAVDGEVDLEAEDLDDYVDWEELRTVLEGDGDDAVEFDVEDLSVSVDADGGIAVE